MTTQKASIVPEYEGITSFQKGQAARLFKRVVDEDQVLIVNKQNKPQNVIISYDRYLRLKNQGIDICTVAGGREE
ncbi:MAG: type II toxin-antitoxin system Phd/YefM family antitoxin [Clostridium sp.]|nr:type II toxin-antitoxin system Phd/YefM family antitoxin [Acetatifactor muris]MCM1526219.1 type II toxin-antitoxin system Phd/YefM family antitoxin [Bacteroides sp.]MCM1562633.1 type II toxin-antitoxin system Phd/YefM family antitoxin [Clostridium sp.]